MPDTPPKPDLSAFDTPGGVPAVMPAAPIAASTTAPAAPKKADRRPPDPKKVALGCVFIVGVLFFILVAVMVLFLAAGDATIQSFGFDPVSFKRWAIGLVYFTFGAVAIGFVVAFIFNLLRFFLAERGAVDTKKTALKHAGVHFVILVITLSLWAVANTYLQRFVNSDSNLPVEIISTPQNTLGVTSPLTIGFSAELITHHFAYKYIPISYEWDKEPDGVVDATGEKVQIYFPNAGKQNGVYKVYLVVRLQPINGQGDIITQKYEKSVSIANQEMYGEIVSDRESGDVPLTVKLDGTQIKNPNGSILNYRWTFDGSDQPEFDGPLFQRVDKTFDTIGEHTVKLTLASSEFDATGTKHLEKTFVKKITVLEPADLKNADAVIMAEPKEGLAPLLVNFDATNSGKNAKQQIDRFEWVVGDGLDRFFGRVVGKKFDKPGTYPVTLKVHYASGAIKTDTVTIHVTDKTYAPVAVIGTDPAPDGDSRAVVGPAPLTVKFNADESRDADNNIVKYEWDFDGDGAFDAEGSRTEYTFKDEGDYRVRLRVTDADKSTNDAYSNVSVGLELPVVDFGATTKDPITGQSVPTVSGPAPLTIDFDASASKLPGRKIVSYEWNFDFKNTGAKKNTFIVNRAQTSHVFPNPGEYVVRLILHADNGDTAYNDLKIVATNIALVAKFTASRTSGVAPLSVAFNPQLSTGTIVGYHWTFGDGDTSDAPQPIHIFERPGVYTVVLTIGDSYNNISRYEQKITVK